MTQSPIAASSQKPQQPISKPSNSDYNKGAESSTSAFSNQSQHRNQLVLLTGGVQFFEALQNAFQQAQHYIALETYIFDFHGDGAQVAAALERAGRRGVRVWVVVDGVGTPKLSEDWRVRFDQAGVEWRVYSPLGAMGLLIPSRWRRLHRKLCVVDGRMLFCGGINVLDDFHDPNYGTLDAPRFDFAVLATGSLVAAASDTMEQLWWRMQAARRARQREFKAAWDALRSAGPVGDFSRLLQKFEAAVGGQLPARRVEQILNLTSDTSRFEATPIHRFIDLFTL